MRGHDTGHCLDDGRRDLRETVRRPCRRGRAVRLRGDTAKFVADVTARLGSDNVITDADVLQSYRRDHAAFVVAGTPVAAVFPRSTAEVVAVVRAATQCGVPIVPRGAGSGLAGGANAVDGAAVLSLTRMNSVLALNADALIAVVQPGVINADLSAQAVAAGVWYPPDPASWEFSTIGGNLATNAGGLCCVKYGVTRDAVLGLEVVLADGSVMRTGSRTVKGVAGYDLVSLLVGSEGTLGVITEATLRLRPTPSPAITLVASFSELAGAGRAIATICRAHTPSLLEILDGVTIRAIDDWKNMDLDREAAALLIAQTDVGGSRGGDEVADMARICNDVGAALVVTSTEPAEAEWLLAARRLAYPALERLGSTLLDDVAVPRDRITDLVSAIERVAGRHGVLIGTFGHAGDGNLHPTVVFDSSDAAARASARAAFEDIVDAALELGGTVTGEHGVGLLKRHYLARELGPQGLRLHRAIKAAFDPEGILNPGKVLG